MQVYLRSLLAVPFLSSLVVLWLIVADVIHFEGRGIVVPLLITVFLVIVLAGLVKTDWVGVMAGGLGLGGLATLFFGSAGPVLMGLCVYALAVAGVVYLVTGERPVVG